MFTRISEQITTDYINLGTTIIGVLVLLAGIAYVVTSPRLFMLGVKNLSRNMLRTLLTAAAIAVFASKITIIWTILYFIGIATTERSKDLKVIVTYRWSVPSQLPITHAEYLNPASPSLLPQLIDESTQKPKYYGPNDFMTWSFYGGSTDPAKITPDTMLFFFAMDPDQIIPMMDEMNDLDPKLVEALKKNIKGCLLGSDKLKMLNKQVGDRFKLSSFNYKGIDLEFDIVGQLPDGRYNGNAIMRMDYFNGAFDLYTRQNKVAHPLASKRLNLIWIRVGDREKFNTIGNIIEDAPQFRDTPVKIETASALVGSFLEAYKEIFSAMKYLLVPGMLVVMALVMANAISITVRERRSEMAVMKVLGYSPNQIMMLVLGEAMFIGAASGLLASALIYAFFNLKWGGLPFRIGFFAVFRIPEVALMWGLAIGSVTTLIGSFIPAWTARSVKVSEVFAKVA